jgi:hypothetical protein
MRKWGVAVAVLGVLMLTGAAVLRFVILPGSMQLPADTNEKVVYTGTMTAPNAAALQRGDMKNAMTRDLPVTVQRTVKVVQTDGNKALISDSSVVTAKQSGQTVATNKYFYTIDRKTMEAVPNFSGQAVQNAQGLVIGFPIGAKQQTYTGWLVEAQNTAPTTYVGEGTVKGVAVYQYKSDATVPVKNPAATGLPVAMPKALLPVLAAASGLSPALQQQLAQKLPALPAIVPLAYTFTNIGNYSVEPTTGVVVNMNRATTTYFSIAGFPAVKIPLSALAITYTPQNLTDMVNKANDGLGKITLYGTTIPLALLILGLISIGGSVLMIRHRKEAPPSAPTTPSKPALTH